MTPRRCETCGAVLVRKKRRRRNGRPNGLEPLPLFLRRKSCGGKCARNGGYRPWSAEDEATMRAVYPTWPNPAIARLVGRSTEAVETKALSMGLKKTAKGRSDAARFAQARRHGRRLPLVHMAMVTGPRCGERTRA